MSDWGEAAFRERAINKACVLDCLFIYKQKIGIEILYTVSCFNLENIFQTWLVDLYLRNTCNIKSMYG